jgi:hypothetical protein
MVEAKNDDQEGEIIPEAGENSDDGNWDFSINRAPPDPEPDYDCTSQPTTAAAAAPETDGDGTCEVQTRTPNAQRTIMPATAIRRPR